MTNEEIMATLLGQTVSKYDGWNNSAEMLTVNKVKVEGNAISLYGVRDNRNYEPCIYFHRDIVERLIITGKYISHQEIDHCPYDVIIEIHPSLEEQFQRRIDSIKSDIKRLKHELKQAQTDYQNYLVSSIRMEVIRSNNELKK